MNSPMPKDYIISWKVAGIALGLLLTLATALVKPLGVSTQFVVTDAMVTHRVAPEFAESNAYLAKYGEPIDWGVGYGWMLVFGMLVGGAATAALFRNRQPTGFSGNDEIRIFNRNPGNRFIYCSGGMPGKGWTGCFPTSFITGLTATWLCPGINAKAV